MGPACWTDDTIFSGGRKKADIDIKKYRYIVNSKVVLFLLVCLTKIIYIGIMTKKKKNGEQFYGTTTLGEKGQVVIPAEARKAMDVKKGDKLLVFGMGCDMLAFSKLSKVEQFASHLASRLDAIREIIKKSKQ